MESFYKLRVKWITLGAMLLFVVVSCQKQSLVPQKDSELSLKVGLPPGIIAWLRGPDVPVIPVFGHLGIARYSPFAFGINGKGYLGGGTPIYDDYSSGIAKDVWEYDTLTRAWSQNADYPGINYVRTATFVIGNQAYVCTGEPGASGEFSKQNWQYDQTTNTWTRKANFGGLVRTTSTAMTINGKGYLGLGSNNSTVSGELKDWWEYDPAQDTWTRKADFPGGKRTEATGFSINNKGFVFGGISPDGAYHNDLWQYNPANNNWKQRASLPAQGRVFAVGYSTSGLGLGIITSGDAGSSVVLNDTWQYNSTSNAWAQLPNAGPLGHDMASGFTIGNTLYVMAGTALDFWSLNLNH